MYLHDFAADMVEGNDFASFVSPSTCDFDCFLFFYFLVVETSTIFPFGSNAAIGTLDYVGSSLFFLAQIWEIERCSSSSASSTWSHEPALARPAPETSKDYHNFVLTSSADLWPIWALEGCRLRVFIVFAYKGIPCLIASHPVQRAPNCPRPFSCKSRPKMK